MSATERGRNTFFLPPGCRVDTLWRVRRDQLHIAAQAVNLKLAARAAASQLPRAQRTRQLAAAQSAVAVELGRHAGARLLQRLARPASADTLLKLSRRAPLPAGGRPRSLGVDDWVIRKRHSYGTIPIDLDGHRVVDLLPDRSAAALAAWPARRKTVHACGCALG